MVSASNAAVARGSAARPPIPVEVVPAPRGDRNTTAALFWALVGDLAADVLLDRVDGPWGTADCVSREKVAA